jgi:hypothetical protein
MLQYSRDGGSGILRAIAPVLPVVGRTILSVLFTADGLDCPSYTPANAATALPGVTVVLALPTPGSRHRGAISGRNPVTLSPQSVCTGYATCRSYAENDHGADSNCRK